MRRVLYAMLLICIVALSTAVRAQTSTVGNISGVVRDPAGAAIAKTEVFIKEERTGSSRTVVTNEAGFFSANSLPFGRYSVSTAPVGFKKTINSGVELHLGENLVVNLTVEIGPVTETLNVYGGAALVETRSANVSSLIAEKQVSELPLNGRNFTQLALMIPGVSPQDSFNSHSTGIDANVSMSVNGNHTTQNMWAVDGVNNMDVGANSVLVVYP